MQGAGPLRMVHGSLRMHENMLLVAAIRLSLA